MDIATHQGDGYVAVNGVAECQQISKKFMVALLDIPRQTEGSMHAVSCLECEPNQCRRAAFCATLPAWAGLEKTVNDYLSSVTLRDLMDQAAAEPEEIPGGACVE